MNQNSATTTGSIHSMALRRSSSRSSRPAAGPGLRVAGAGTVNLVSQALDYKVNATVLKQPTSGPATAANTLALVPVTITGSLASPKVSPDLQGIAKARLQQELDKHKGDLQQKLQDQLKNILK